MLQNVVALADLKCGPTDYEALNSGLRAITFFIRQLLNKLFISVTYCH